MCLCDDDAETIESGDEVEVGVKIVGEHCEHVAEVLVPGASESVAPPLLHVGRWQYFYVPLPPPPSGDSAQSTSTSTSSSSSHPLVIELAYPRSPAASPMLFATKAVSSSAAATAAVPKLEAACASFWGSGPYGDTHCHVTGYAADFQYPPTLTDSFGSGTRITTVHESGMDYAALTIPPEDMFITGVTTTQGNATGNGGDVASSSGGYTLCESLRTRRAALEYTIRASFADPMSRNVLRLPRVGRCVARPAAAAAAAEVGRHRHHRDDSRTAAD